MIITEQLALQIGYTCRFTWSTLTVYFKTFADMQAEHALLPVNNVTMQQYIDDTWIDLD